MRDVRGHGGAASPSDATFEAASYEDFVATRGPALFRTAFLLAGSTTDAETLLQAALVRLFPPWRRARRQGSTEAFAIRVLLATFLSGRQPLRILVEPLVTVPAERQPDPDPAERLPLWSGLAALEPRQRAVVVLGYADGLGDHQIAELLGISPRTVTNTGGSALAALESATGRDPDDVRDRLSAELRQVAESRPLPDVAAEGLARVGAAERVRRRKGLLAAAAAAVVLVLGTAFLPRLVTGRGDVAGPAHPPRHPGTLAQLAVGPESTLPWWSGGELHLGSRVLPTNHDEVVAAAGTILVGNVYVSGFDHLASWWYVTEQGLVPLASSTTSVFAPSVSPDGRLVAWAEPHGRNHRTLVLWDVRRERAIGRLGVRIPVACCGRGSDAVIRGVDARGQVFFDTGGALRVWRPGERPRVVRGISGALYEVNAYPEGLTWQAHASDPLGPFPISYGWVDDRGVVHRAGSLPNGALWSPDGEGYAFVGEQQRSGEVRSVPDEVWVTDALHSRAHRMRLPRRRSYQLVGWESPASVVVAVRRDTGRPLRGSDLPTQVQLLRCHVDSAACETAGLASQSILGLSP